MIRKASIGDLDSIWVIYAERFDSYDSDDIKYTLDDLRWYLENDAAIMLVYDVGEIAGFVFGYNLGIWGYMEHIVVSAKYRGNGYARELIERFVNHNDDWRIVEACHYTEMKNMSSFFKSIGWRDGLVDTRWIYTIPNDK